MATIIHKAAPESDISEWYAKAEPFHMESTGNFGLSWRYVIMRGNIIEGIEAKW